MPLPHVREAPPWANWEPCDALGIAAWADDFVLLQVHKVSAELCVQAVAAVQVMTEHATAMGMVLTFARDKTAALFSADCAPGGLVHDEQQGPGLVVPNTVLHLPVVDSYKHLGGIITANHALLTGIAFRNSQAEAMLKPLKGCFPPATFPWTCGEPCFVPSSFPGLCLLGPPPSYSLWGGLVKRTCADRSPHSFDVLHQARAPSPLLELAMMRAVQLRRMLQYGPAHSVGRSWLGSFLSDMQAVAVYSSSPHAFCSELPGHCSS